MFESSASRAGARGTGIYGVLSGGVAERTREIGVRSALGASRGSILALMVRQGMTLTVLGILLGLLGIDGSQPHPCLTLLLAVNPSDPLAKQPVGLLFVV